MRYLIILIIISLLFTGFLLPQQETNILLITVDTLRWDHVSIYQKKHVNTPAIDALARKGSTFYRAFAHTPITLASHVSILTGTTPLYHGVHGNGRFFLNSRFLTLAELLKKSKYTTAAFVASTVLASHRGLNQGFDIYDEPTNTRIAEEMVSRTKRWLKNQKGKWFCWLHLWDPHMSYNPPAPFSDRYKNDLYSGEVAYTDFQLGKFMEFMAGEKLLENTVVILTADHGEGLGDHEELEHGHFAYNTTIHVPLIFSGKNIPRGRFNEYVSHIDIFPTICDLLKIKIPSQVKGKSLHGLLHGQPYQEIAIYFESKDPFYSFGWAPLEGYIIKNRKFIHQPIPELYDLADDFSEKRNIISSAPLNRLKQPLLVLKKFHSGEIKALPVKQLSSRELDKLKSLGYMGTIRENLTPEEAFFRDNDLKKLVPIQNLFKLAASHKEEKEFDQAILLYQQIIKKMPTFLPAYMFMATVYERQKKLDLAKNILEQGLKLTTDKNGIGLRLTLASLSTKTNDIDRAIQIYKKILSIEENNAEAWTYLGVSQGKKGKLDTAYQAFNRAIKADPRFSLAHYNLGMYHLLFFQKNRQAEHYNRAKQSFTRAIETDPNSAMSYNGRAIAYRLNNEIQLAIEDWSRVLKINPNFTDAYFYLARTYIGIRDKAKALNILNLCKKNLDSRLSPPQRNQLNSLIQQASTIPD